MKLLEDVRHSSLKTAMAGSAYKTQPSNMESDTWRINSCEDNLEIW